MKNLTPKVLAYVRQEPVRAVIQPVIGLFTVLALAKGLIDDDTATIIGAIAGGILGIGGAATVRGKVTPVGNVQAAEANVVAQVQQTLEDNHLQPPDIIVNQVRDAVAQLAGRHRANG